MTCWLLGCSNLYVGAVICSVRPGLGDGDFFWLKVLVHYFFWSVTINNAVKDYQIVHLPLNFLVLILYSYFIKFLPKTQNLMVGPDLPITENSINHLLMVARAYPPCPFRLSYFSLKFLILVPIVPICCKTFACLWDACTFICILGVLWLV